MNKKKIAHSIIICLVVIVVLGFPFLSGLMREPRFSALRVGTTNIPTNLMPYADSGSAATFITSMIYDTMLGSISVANENYLPSGAERIGYIDDLSNPFRFADNLVYAVGAYPKQYGSTMGRVDNFQPSNLERNILLARRGFNPFANPRPTE